MKKIILLSLLTASTLMARKLTVKQGVVHAHTEVFGDSSIDPKTSNITSNLTMNGDIQSITGSVKIDILKLKSDNSQRDEHMLEALEGANYPSATFTFKKIDKRANDYAISGILKFHGVKKALTIYADITNSKNSLTIKGKSSFLLSNYNVKPIKMLFLTVRDQIDLKINVTFNKK